MSFTSRRRRASASIVANPVLIGAVTLLVTLVAVFLAYNANSGLPFVPTTQVKVLIANGSEIVKGDEVRTGGFLVGLVKSLRPVTLQNGDTVAQLTLSLNRTVGKIPVDSTATIRPRSVLGLKYVQLTRGSARRYLADGDTIALTHTSVPVELDQVLGTFDASTRRNARQSLVNFGDAFAGRGPALNQTIANLPPLFGFLTPVAANLADPRTQLAEFFRALDRAASQVAPVAAVNARLFTDMATTFAAISHDPAALRATISESPPTLAVGTRSLHDQRPFLRHLAAFSADEISASRVLRSALPQIDPALEAGTRVLPRTPQLNRELAGVLASLRRLSLAPTTNLALRGLTATVGTLQPQLRYLGPYVTVCNYWNYFWTVLSEHMTGFNPLGADERILAKNAPATQPNALPSEGATQPVQGGGSANPFQGDPAFLHGQPYGPAVTTKGLADCESGQRGYPGGNLTTFAPQLAGVVNNPETPGVQGSTFQSLDNPGNLPAARRRRGTARVPRGETFNREPQFPGSGLPPALQIGP